jgi:hypothetical protein
LGKDSFVIDARQASRAGTIVEPLGALSVPGDEPSADDVAAGPLEQPAAMAASAKKEAEYLGYRDRFMIMASRKASRRRPRCGWRSYPFPTRLRVGDAHSAMRMPGAWHANAVF